MDNFGIFKLLNSFYDFMSKNKGQSAKKDDAENPVVTPPEHQKNPPAVNNNASNTASNNAPEKYSVPPLQAGMINTLKNHDEFVRRVMKNKNTPPR